MPDFDVVIFHIFFQVRLPERDPSEASFVEAASSRPQNSLPSKSTQQSHSTQDKKETGWPIFCDGGMLLPTEFKEDLWKCPFCDLWTNRIRQHLKKHSDRITDMAAVDSFCNEVSATKRKRLEKKRAADSKRKESLAKADAKRAADPKRQRADLKRRETYVKADAKRSADPKRKETRQKAEAKRAMDPVRRQYLMTRAQTKLAKFSKQIAQEKYLEKLGNIRKKAQNRRYEQTRVDKRKGGDAITRRIKFQKAVLRGPEYACSSCHRTLFKKSVSAVTEKLVEKMRAASQEKELKELKEKEQKTDFLNLPSKSKSQLKSPSKLKILPVESELYLPVS